MTELGEEYRQRFDKILVPIASNLQGQLTAQLAGLSNIDRIAARAKAPHRFLEKAEAVTDQGTKKYSRPLTEIQDQIGARIVVLYVDDVRVVEAEVLRYYRPIELTTIVPDSQWTFGYFGLHLILALPGDVVPPELGVGQAPQFFELQIQTLFQHAWAEANHDLGYKPSQEIPEGHQRKLAFVSAQAWGADHIFGELNRDLKLAKELVVPDRMHGG